MDPENLIKDKDPLKITTIELAELMVAKHSNYSELYRKEIEGFSKQKDQLEQEKKEAKKKRDEHNERVQELKKKRNEMSVKARELRERFFGLMQEKALPEDEKKKMKMYKNQLSNVEWKLETEGIDLETEKRLMKEAKLCFLEIDKINTAIREENDRQSEMMELSQKISDAMNESRGIHEEMVRLVEEADVHHDKFIKNRRVLKENASGKERKERWIKKHEEAKEYWMDYLKALHEKEAVEKAERKERETKKMARSRKMERERESGPGRKEGEGNSKDDSKEEKGPVKSDDDKGKETEHTDEKKDSKSGDEGKETERPGEKKDSKSGDEGKEKGSTGEKKGSKTSEKRTDSDLTVEKKDDKQKEGGTGKDGDDSKGVKAEGPSPNESSESTDNAEKIVELKPVKGEE